MGIIERRDRERLEVRKQILDAARELFAREGYERVTMRGIAEAIEYSPTTIYNHFEDKDDLLQSLCEEDFTRLLGALREQPSPSDPIEAIRQLGQAYASFGVSHPNHYRFLFMTPRKFRSAESGPSPAGKQAFGLLRSAVESGVAQGRLRRGDVDTMAQVLWAHIHGAVALLITFTPEHFPNGPAAADLVPQVIDTGLRGLLPAKGQ
jgi:AcrR family transcriptional regulator